MAEFVSGNQLNLSLEKIFENAEKHLVLISPYIKLHSRFVDVLKSKSQIDKLKITIVFGKNEENISKSLNVEDFKFLREFPNLEIRYEPRLHAKYYANEYSSLLSSMNLYDFSQNNNIEFGIIAKSSLAESVVNDFIGKESLDEQAYNYFETVIENSKVLYKREPQYEGKLMGLTKKYIGSNVTIDYLDKILLESSKELEREEKTKVLVGYCIRTGEQIEFNPKKPFSDKAFKSWNRYKDEGYQEKFCHYSGEPSNGETSFAKPILKKNWSKAKVLF